MPKFRLVAPFGPAGDQREFFELPLVHGHRGISNGVQIVAGAGVSAQESRELGPAAAFGTGADDQDATVVLHNMRGGGDAFDALAPGEVERVTGAGGDDGIHGLPDGLQQG